MKIKDITAGQEVAVFFYGNANSLMSNKYNGKYSYAAEKATVLEAGVRGKVYHGRSMYAATSATANYVKVVRENGREETVVCTKIVGDWETYAAEQREIVDARIKREVAAEQSRSDVDSRLKAIAKKLGLEEYQLPTVSSGGCNYDANTLSYNKRKLVEALELALAYNEK